MFQFLHCFLHFLLTKAIAQVVDSSDLLNGQGLFLSMNTSLLHYEESHDIRFIQLPTSNVLRLEKPNGKQVSYKEGLLYTFNETKINHVQFYFASSNPNIEDSNLRIYDRNQTTLVLFRAGRGGLLRVNEQQMISFYNESISTDSNILLTRVDLMFDWQEKKIEIFINNKYMESCNFFQQSVGEVSRVLLYNLYDSVSYWSNLVICSSVCYSFNYQLINHIFILIFIAVFM